MTKSTLIVLMALMISSCASRRDIASTQEKEQNNFGQTQHAQMIEGAASRIR